MLFHYSCHPFTIFLTIFQRMPIVPLYGHHALRSRLLQVIAQGRLPATILLHGHPGIGKQRLALWLAQALLCERDDRPCGVCHPCRYALELKHPDLYWFYPRPRLKDHDPGSADVLEDYMESTMDRVSRRGLYPHPPGTDGLYIATIRTIVQRASLAPAMGHRKVFIVGDAERMVSQEGADQAANAFLKLLEEPPANTTIVLTSSEPGALLPTIRSRVVAFRCAPLGEAETRAFLSDLQVQEALAALDVPLETEARIVVAGGSPGRLFWGEALDTARLAARQMVAAADRGGEAVYATALAQWASSARGAFSETLDALQRLLRERTRDAIARGDMDGASGASRAIDAVLRAQERAEGNVNPQLVTAQLLRELALVLS